VPDWANEEFMTVAEVAALLRLNQQTIRNWLDAGKLPHIRVGRRVRILRSDLDHLIETGYDRRAATEQGAEGISPDRFWDGSELPAEAIPPTAGRS
jgi:excisionase family DNA binding protein